ncbi:hypothetical protein FBY10_10178 [Pseudomonas sp. SJZ103]|uniref:gp53-like domain-containing protein n=1 Tax=unclassified Pseudomonas TaxID=196821 RepID=UPI0011A37650|nr:MULTISPECIES: hypothetical protein [unclassified Pseudomonas]TWC74388.1 hypothetical protein FBY10_10178 [Pseudomonas sp. SJZ103]TWC93483.1 hypothetical protein FBY08_101980 [Pseudomonas sp. SJZ094]
MANLPEAEDFSEGTYQIETSDRVIGGPGGTANKQAEQLGNRTAWLRAALDKIVSGTTSVGKATQLANSRVLKFKGALSGSGSYDGSADTEITLTLADSGFAAGSYTKVTTNAKGLVVSGENPTTLDGIGITDAVRSSATEVFGKVSDLADSCFVILTDKTTDKPAAISYGAGLHIKYPGFKQGFELVSGITNEWFGVRRVLEDGTGVYRKVWTDADFSPQTYAPLASPDLSGTPRAPTATVGTNTEQIANTAFVQAAIAALVNAAPGALNDLNELATAIGNDPNFAATIMNALSTKAPLASPLLSGKPKAPTPGADADSDQIANVEYAKGIRSAVEGGVSEALNTLAKLAGALALKAPLDSALLSGKPKAPTAPLFGEGSNNEQIANTRFVQSLLAALFPKRVFLANDFIRIPDTPGGFIIQFGSAVVAPEGTTDVTLPISFNNIRGAIAGMGVSGWNTNGNYSAYAGLKSQSVITLTQDVSSTSGAGNQTLYYLAWGN